MRAIGLTLALALAGCSDKSADDSGSASLTGDASAGAEIYGLTCAACHGADGNVNEAKLTEEVPEKSDAELESIILDGYEEMPPQSLTGQETADVIAYLRETFPG